MSKAISPVIASLLMLVVVVAILIIFYGFSVGLIGGSSTTISEASAGMTSSTAAGFIEETSATYNTIYIRLTNDVSTNIDAVFVDGNRVVCGSGPTLSEGSETGTLTSSECSGLTLERNQVLIVTGSNNFRATGRS